jgi:restriction system protein
MATAPDIPRQTDLMWPTIEALRRLGGSARIDEIAESVVETEGFTEEQQQVTRSPDDHMPLIDYRLAWARNYLKNIGAIENSARGVWSLTPLGQTIVPEAVPDLVKDWKREYSREYQRRKKEAEDAEEGEGVVNDAADWRDVLLGRLLAMPPDGFERLAQRLLREAGFRNVEVTGRSGDGGIDGVGVYRLSLVSFPVYFQCKRYSGTVGAHAVRDFRGAMSGRGEKGLLITTGSFTRDAREEATRDGAPPVELISGEDLCDLLREYSLGVTTETVEVYSVERGFFDQF